MLRFESSDAYAISFQINGLDGTATDDGIVIGVGFRVLWKNVCIFFKGLHRFAARNNGYKNKRFFFDAAIECVN